MDNEKDTMRRLPPYRFIEVGGYIAISMPVLFCIGAILAAWFAKAGLCDWWVPILAGLTVAGLGGGIVWLWLIVDRNKLLWHIETATGIDIDRDGVTGKPRFVYVRGARETMQHKTIEEAERFRLFLRGVYGERGPTWRAWDGALTQEQWQDYCGRLLDANLAERRGETSSLTLTSTYREALRVFAEIL